MRKTWILLAVLLLCAVCSVAKEYPRGISITKKTDGYEIRFVLPEYYTGDMYADGVNYKTLDISGYGENLDYGRPRLPQLTISLMISPEEQAPVIEVLDCKKVLEILNDKIYPVQYPIPKDSRSARMPYVIDTQYYNSRGNFNDPPVKISETFVIAGASGVMITIQPFAYDPSTKRLNVMKSGVFRIRLRSEAVLRHPPTGEFNRLFNAIFLNYDAAKSYGTRKYLIITPPEYESGLTPLINEKQSLNYAVTVANTNVTGTTNSAIKAYIQNLYNNINTRPEFVLLVGDIDKIPEWVGVGMNSPHTDLNYSLLEGNDPYPDVFLGRFPVANTVHLANMINKTLYMDNAINFLPKKNALCSSYDLWPVAEGTNNFCIDSFFIPAVYANIKLYCHTYSATTQQLLNALNANQIFLLYSGHGSETAWGDGPPFNQSNINSLTNSVYPFVYSFSCLTGSYHQSYECFGETWVRGQRGGAVFWGSTVTSYLYPDDILQKRIFRAVFTEHLIKTSPSYVLGKFLLSQYYGGVGSAYGSLIQGYMEMYNCLGDPSIYMDGYGPSVSHNQIQNTENLSGPYTVNCTITENENPINASSLKVFWTRGSGFSDSVNLVNVGGNNYSAVIYGNNSPSNYKYYIKASDVNNIASCLPVGAPVKYFRFSACSDTTKPVIEHTPITNKIKPLWPVSIRANVTDNIGIDSVWVNWYINSPANGFRHLKLINTSGNTYASAFNSVQNEVNINDTIRYRIIAKDNSAAGNRDSTVLYSFVITYQSYVYIGSGTSATNYPFATGYSKERVQILYLAEEISPNHLPAAPAYITQIGLRVADRSPQALGSFNVKMQNTSTGSVSGLSNSGWTVCYSGSYTVPGTGWIYINLNTPFLWDGSGNLLVEFCFDNSTYSYDSYVYASECENKMWGNRSYTYAGCTMGGGIKEYSRPNICLVMSETVGITNFSEKMPERFCLYQNYPNPFNPITRIVYDVPSKTQIVIKIHDVLGREMKTLVNEIKPQGRYSVEFDGSELPSGVYFYKIQSEKYSEVKRMILLK